MIATAVSAILRNFYIVFFVIAICTTIAKLRRARMQRRVVSATYVLWGEILLYNVGIGFIYAGIFHAYFQRIAAPSIGWSPSPFEYELGWMEIGLGCVAVLALWRGFEFRLAATVTFVVFSLAAAAQHVDQIACCRNYAPDNAGLILWFQDIFLALLLALLAALSQGEQAR